LKLLHGALELLSSLHILDELQEEGNETLVLLLGDESSDVSDEAVDVLLRGFVFSGGGGRRGGGGGGGGGGGLIQGAEDEVDDFSDEFAGALLASLDAEDDGVEALLVGEEVVEVTDLDVRHHEVRGQVAQVSVGVRDRVDG